MLKAWVQTLCYTNGCISLTRLLGYSVSEVCCNSRDIPWVVSLFAVGAGRHLMSTSSGTLSLPAVVIIFLTKCLICSACSCGTSIQMESCTVITIRAPVLRAFNSECSLIRATFNKWDSTCCKRVAFMIRFNLSLFRTWNRRIRPVNGFQEFFPISDRLQAPHTFGRSMVLFRCICQRKCGSGWPLGFDQSPYQALALSKIYSPPVPVLVVPDQISFRN